MTMTLNTSLNANTTADLSHYIHHHKPLWNTIAILYTLSGYVGGIALLTLANGWLNSLGVILLAHSLIYSAYLSHEFMHGTIFKHRSWNVAFGMGMLWLNGGCYYGFQALLRQHVAHHVDRADVLTFDIPAAVQRLPRLLRYGVVALEWCYFPIVAFWSRWQSLTAPWRSPERREDQRRIASIFAIRAVLFALLAVLSYKALLLYFLAYVGMITALRWMDAFQHTYEGFPPGTPLPKRDSAHEQAHTFSNLVSRQHPWLNLLFLNFGYHNAHHAVMKCPWHSLHDLDRDMAQDETHGGCYISLWQQMLNYHRFRITRLFGGQGEARQIPGSSNFEQFYGAADVSFLTLY